MWFLPRVVGTDSLSSMLFGSGQLSRAIPQFLPMHGHILLCCFVVLELHDCSTVLQNAEASTTQKAVTIYQICGVLFENLLRNDAPSMCGYSNGLQFESVINPACPMRSRLRIVATTQQPTLMILCLLIICLMGSW